MKWVLSTYLVLLLLGCGGGEKASDENLNVDENTEVTAEIPDNTDVDNYKILLVGNSHVRNLKDQIEVIVNTTQPGKSVYTELAPGSNFLAERLGDGVTLEALQSKDWTHVIWQAQKYSTSGQFNYPITAARTWIKRTKEIGATPIMFPEHPTYGNAVEAQRIHELHDGIAKLEPACVAPVGLAWDEARLRVPQLRLHHADGNHAAEAGSLLTALVFYQVITTEPAQAVPYIPDINVEESNQQHLTEIASHTLSLHPPCNY